MTLTWWKRRHRNEAERSDAMRRLHRARSRDDEVNELVGWLKQKRVENHFGEKFHAALRAGGGHH